MSEWFVYILRCPDDTLYTGITTDLVRRCQQDNAGTASRKPRSHLPVLWSTMRHRPVDASLSKESWRSWPFHVSKKSCGFEPLV